MKKPSTTPRAGRGCSLSPAAILLLAGWIYLAALFADIIVTLLTR